MEEWNCSSVILNPGRFTLGEAALAGGAGWAPEPLNKVAEQHNVLSLLGFEPRHVQLVAYSLYPVRYVGYPTSHWTLNRSDE